MKINSIQYIRESIESGAHRDWSELVDELKTGRSEGLRLSVREAFLVVAFRGSFRLTDGDKTFVEAAPDTGWNLLAVPVTGENALRTISACTQGIDGTVRNYKLTEPIMTAVPIGMACVGRTHDGGWDTDFMGVNVEGLAKECGRSPQKELRLVTDFAFKTAEGPIAKLKALGDIGSSENPAN
jgi:hypothetical protein